MVQEASLGCDTLEIYIVLALAFQIDNPALFQRPFYLVCRDLEQDALYNEVSALLALADACMQKVPASQASAQLLREGFKNPMSTYKFARRDLQVNAVAALKPLPN